MNTDDSHQMQDVAWAVLAVVIAAIVGTWIAEHFQTLGDLMRWGFGRFL